METRKLRCAAGDSCLAAVGLVHHIWKYITRADRRDNNEGHTFTFPLDDAGVMPSSAAKIVTSTGPTYY